MDNPDDCSVCSEEYHENNRPRLLPCGHTYCTNCIRNLLQQGNVSTLKCPNCQVDYNMPPIDQIPINFAFESTLNALKRMSDELYEEKSKRIKLTNMDTLITETNKSIHDSMKTMGETVDQLDAYQNYLKNKKAKHNEVLEKAEQLITHHKAMVEDIDREYEKIEEVKDERKDLEREAQTMTVVLDTAESKQDKSIAFHDLISASGKLESWVSDCKSNFPDVNIGYSKQFLEKSKTCLEEALAAKFDHVPWPIDYPEEETFMQRVDLLPNVYITLDQLKNNLAHWKNHIKAGTVFAVYSNGTGEWSARLTLKDDRIYLHSFPLDYPNTNTNQAPYNDNNYDDAGSHLNDDFNSDEDEDDDDDEFNDEDNDQNSVYSRDARTPEPQVNAVNNGTAPLPDGWKIEFDELNELFNKEESICCFMDLWWNGENQGRVHILLSPKSQMALQFRILCTGERGKGYLDSYLTGLGHDPYISDYVIAGEYTPDDATMGDISNDIDPVDGIYTRRVTTGSLQANLAYKLSPHFKIVVGQGSGHSTCNGVFGQIQTGMDVVLEAARQENVRSVRIHECGVVLEL